MIDNHKEAAICNKLLFTPRQMHLVKWESMTGP